MRPGTATEKRVQRRNRPHKDSSWIWLTSEMLESPAWRAMSINARRVVDRIVIEHLHHAGTENGKLIVTYDDFEKFGIRRSSIKPAIKEATALGWIDCTQAGRMAYADIRIPSHYALTWLYRSDGTPASNRWKRYEDEQSARSAAKNAIGRKKARKPAKAEPLAA